jgi:hypothetical protein
MLKAEMMNAEKQIDLLRRQLEDEVLLRTELENRMHTLKDDLEFSRRSHHNVSFGLWGILRLMNELICSKSRRCAASAKSR